jgi:large subunit ribosomal protein L7/L12
LVDALPKPVKEGVAKEEAEKIKAQLEAAGAQVEVK